MCLDVSNNRIMFVLVWCNPKPTNRYPPAFRLLFAQHGTAVEPSLAAPQKYKTGPRVGTSLGMLLTTRPDCNDLPLHGHSWKPHLKVGGIKKERKAEKKSCSTTSRRGIFQPLFTEPDLGLGSDLPGKMEGLRHAVYTTL